MTCKVNSNGIVCLDEKHTRNQSDEMICLHCDGAGLVNNRVCSSCNGHGKVFYNPFTHKARGYEPNKEQWEAMQKLGGVA